MYLWRTFQSFSGKPAPGLINTRRGRRPPDSEVVRIINAELTERHRAVQGGALELYDPELLAERDFMDSDDDDDFE